MSQKINGSNIFWKRKTKCYNKSNITQKWENMNQILWIWLYKHINVERVHTSVDESLLVYCPPIVQRIFWKIAWNNIGDTSQSERFFIMLHNSEISAKPVILILLVNSLFLLKLGNYIPLYLVYLHCTSIVLLTNIYLLRLDDSNILWQLNWFS